MSAIIKRVKAVNPILNAVVDDRFEEAVEDARAVDDRIASLSQSELDELEYTQPLLGVPFSVKDFIMIKGEAHSGYKGTEHYSYGVETCHCQ